MEREPEFPRTGCTVKQVMPMNSPIEASEVHDEITSLEKGFPLPDLLTLEFFRQYRHDFYYLRDELRSPLPSRNYRRLLQSLMDIHEYSEDDAKGFAKLLRDDKADKRNSQAHFAHIIVYRFYIRLVYEGIIKAVKLGRKECDVVLERLDGSVAYLEVFSVMPTVAKDANGVYKYKAHLQEEMGSIRQKLLRKCKEQGQMSKPRENYAVIETNDVSISGGFSVLSSLSSGYKVWFDKETGQRVASGYDWHGSVFDDDATRHLKGVIWFSQGDYESRGLIENPMFSIT
jgi:hypothetical protein